MYYAKEPQRADVFHLTPTTDIYYELRGISSNAKVLLLAGAMATTKHFEELADLLAERYEVMTFNYRGVGRSKIRGRQPVHTRQEFRQLTVLHTAFPLRRRAGTHRAL